MISIDKFEGRKGIKYFGQFKLNEPVEIDQDVFIVPAGWDWIDFGNGLSGRACVSYFVGPESWSDSENLDRFRDWVIFDCFVMWNPYGISLYDKGKLPIEPVRHNAYNNGPVGKEDADYTIDSADICCTLVQEFERPTHIPKTSYPELYAMYRGMGRAKKEMIEWAVSTPPSPVQPNAFFGSYWSILHKAILIDSIVGPPPTCSEKTETCQKCGRPPQDHHAMSRKDWLKHFLIDRIKDEAIAEEASSTITAALQIRNPMSHGPHFDRSTRPSMATHFETRTYSHLDAIKAFKSDSHALGALNAMLYRLAHSLAVSEAFEVSYFRPAEALKVVSFRAQSAENLAGS